MNHGNIGTSSGLPPPKTPNDIYGFAQKAILHSIFDKQTGIIGQSSQGVGPHGNVKTRHTTPFISNLG